MGHAQSHVPVGTVAAVVEEATGTSPAKCYQCGRCAAGCAQNVPGEMPHSPTRILRLLQLEAAFAADPDVARQYADEALGSDTPWLCAGCLACTTRCPQGVDIAGVMDTLREEALKRGKASKSRRARDIQKLHQVFLGEATSRGRIHELLMVMKYKLRTGHLFQDATVAPGMFLRGKLHVLPKASPSPQRVLDAAQKLKEQGGER